MPQFVSPFTVNDGSATPVAVTYSVEKLSSEQTVLVDRRQASRDMQPVINASFDRATPNRKTFKVKRQVAYPLIRAINSVDTVVDTARATIEYVIPVSATAQERKHLRALVANLEDATFMKAAVEDLDPLY